MQRPGSSSSATFSQDHYCPAPSPPPTIPLPPIPTRQESSVEAPPQDEPQAMRTQPYPSEQPYRGTYPKPKPHPFNIRVVQNQTPSATPTTSLSRAGSTIKRLLPTSNLPPSPNTGMMFDLDPEIASDPFASVIGPPTTTSRLERERAAYARSRGDLRRVKMQTGDLDREGRWTPPPQYELDGAVQGEVGRAV